ncbi:Hypothetical protein CpMEX30_1925 [Corynebacterium pseudotuberculosis]|uniref:HNH endonuclease signature motif containing protein n=1 Tax=Corynebacterium pseudotuberculosis TaxID=1719 RepID=UPI00094752D9|nr:Hypothetical protein CpMEX30_1925 [Corynebacterium pseudotuberculosis]
MKTWGTYRGCNMEDPLCVSERRALQCEYHRWAKLIPDKNTDIAEYCISIGERINKGPRYVELRIDALQTLRALPLLHQLEMSLWHLDFSRLIAIAQSLYGVETDLFEVIDEALAHYLHPKRANQKVPTAQAIRRFLHKLLESLNEAIEEPEQNPEPRVSFFETRQGKTVVHAVVDNGTAHLIKQRLAQLAREHACTDAEAFFFLASGQAPVVHLYSVKGSDTIETIDGSSFSPAVNKAITESAIWRDLDPYKDTTLAHYAFTGDLRRWIQARDGTCRFPGCSVASWHCDIDHIEEYGPNGLTKADNAQCLCRKHHNLKTSKAVDCIAGEDGEVTWLLDRDLRITTEPAGIMSEQRMFGQSFIQRAAKRIKKRRQMRKADRDYAADAPPF